MYLLDEKAQFAFFMVAVYPAGIGVIKANSSYFSSSVKAERALEDDSGAVLSPRGAQRGSERGPDVATMAEAAEGAIDGTTAAKTAPKKKNNMVMMGEDFIILYVA